MLGPRRSPQPGGTHIHKDKLMSKLLMRIVSEIQNRGGKATPEMMDQARRDIEFAWEGHQGKMTDRDLKKIAAGLVKQSRAQSSMDAPKEKKAAQAPPPRSYTPPEPLEVRDSVTPNQHPDDSADMQSLLKNTTRKQREMIADADWVDAAEEDRKNGIFMKKKDRENKVNFMSRQRNILDEQIDEHNEQKRQSYEAKMKSQRDMNDHIDTHRRLTRDERQAAHDKAMREKQFRDQQHKQIEDDRERARQEEHDEQVRHYLMVKEELRKQREGEFNHKMKKKSEWKTVLEDNQHKLQEKERAKEREREIDRDFQRKFTENLDRVDRERAEDKARKEARAAYFQQLANGVASLFMAKEADQTNKIESEYQEQLRRAMEDERNRKDALKKRTLDCLNVQKQQCQELKQQRDADREESRRLAEALRDQVSEGKRQEHARKMAERAEAQRMKEFLNTQLQLQHFKETRQLETSIARPASRAQTMFSPSRYTPSPKLDILPAQKK